MKPEGLAPNQPTQAMIGAHEVSHLLYRDWCSARVRGHSKSQPHKNREEFSSKQIPSGPQGLRILCPGPENSEGVRDTEMPSAGGEVQVGMPSA